MTDFTLELRSEEIPARMQVKAKDDLARLFAEEIAKAGLVATSVETFATARRLALIAHGLPDMTEAVREERKGPRANAPDAALAGFLRSTGLAREQLVERGGVLFAVVEKPGRPTAAVLAEAIPAIVRGFPWPKAMRWGAASSSTESLRWVRPLEGIVALFGDAIVPCEIGGIHSGASTVGHRFHHPGPITIGDDDYVEKLRACHVMVHLSERSAIIRDGASALAQAEGLPLVEDEALVIENAGLTEWPVPLLGRFDAAFLDVPAEVIQLTMRTNQKYFACRDASGALANAFVCTANIAPSDGGAAIVAGNERVLAARLADAKFFWENDLRVPLDEQAKKLDRIVFHEKLGTVADKVDRIAKLARWLVETGVVTANLYPERQRGAVSSVSETSSPEKSRLRSTRPLAPLGEVAHLATLAERAARLCKADLVTGMVGEFPELQGIIGGHLARAQGEDPQVADAIRDHYKPVGQGDDVPTAPVNVAVSLADKLDTVFSFFLAEMPPTGSKDPFALRRAAIGTLQVLLKCGLRLPLARLAPEWGNIAFDVIRPGLQRETLVLQADNARLKYLTEHIKVNPNANRSVVGGAFVKGKPTDDLVVRTIATGFIDYMDGRRNFEGEILDFFADRLKVQQREAGVRHDLIDAVFALGGEDDLVRLLARVRALQAFVEGEDGAKLLGGYKRAANILKKEGWGDVDTVLTSPLSYTPEPCEAALIGALDSAEPLAAAAVAREDFEGAMAALAGLRAPIDAFFDSVTVNDPDPARRTARLALLARLRDAVHTVADFSKIEG